MNFADWINGLIGGLLIGCSACCLMFCLGRVAGISGITARLFSSFDLDSLWRWFFIIGLLFGVLVFSKVVNEPDISINSSSLLLIIAGLLVGFGTRLGNGCTSGHGICGIARFSLRSITATVVFMIVAIITVWLTKTWFM